MKAILFGGSIATGKSTFSKRYAQTLGLPRVAMDDLKEAMFNLVGVRDREWSSQIGKAVFPVFQELVEMHLRRGESVVAEAVFSWVPQDAQWIDSLTNQYGADVRLVWLTADPRVARQRFLDRAHGGYHPGHRHTTQEVLNEFDQKYFNRVLEPIPIRGQTKIVDTTDFDAVDHDEILKWISEKDRE